MVLGILRPWENNREIKPGSGHEDICCMVNGIVSICRGDDCFGIQRDETCVMHNEGPTDAI